jgi:hypothetical protein
MFIEPNQGLAFPQATLLLRVRGYLKPLLNADFKRVPGYHVWNELSLKSQSRHLDVHKSSNTFQ